MLIKENLVGVMNPTQPQNLRKIVRHLKWADYELLNNALTLVSESIISQGKTTFLYKTEESYGIAGVRIDGCGVYNESYDLMFIIDSYKVGDLIYNIQSVFLDIFKYQSVCFTRKQIGSSVSIQKYCEKDIPVSKYEMMAHY